MKSVRYLALSAAIFVIAAGVLYFAFKYTGNDSFDSFQSSAGKGGFDKVEKSKEGDMFVLRFSGLKVIYTGGVCTGSLSVTTPDDASSKLLMKHRYDAVNYISEAVSGGMSLDAAAVALAEKYKSDKKIPYPGTFSFQNFNCVPQN
jgi:hypothetical protein